MEVAADDRASASTTSAADSIPTRARLVDPVRVRSLSIHILAILAIFYTLYFARSLFIAIVFALVLKGALVRPVRLLKRLHVPPPLSALVLLTTLIALLGYGAYALSEPATTWMNDLPQKMRLLESKLTSLSTSLSTPIEEVSKQVEQIASRATDEAKPLQVQIADEQSTVEWIGTNAWSFLVDFLIMIVLLYFLLVTDEVFLDKVAAVLSRRGEKGLVVETGLSIERHISTYLLTITVINVCLGAVLAGAFALLGLPDPLLLGVMVFALNFIPYVGAFVGIGVVAAISLLTFDTIASAALPPLAYFIATVTEGMLVSPHVLGRILTLSPVAIFLWLLLWSFLWGVPGALLAVPMLAIVKIICDNIPSLRPVGVFLGE